jgi:hypothetical protein
LPPRLDQVFSVHTSTWLQAAYPLFSYSCALLSPFFAGPSLIFNDLRPLFPKHPGGGIPAQSDSVQPRVRRFLAPSQTNRYADSRRKSSIYRFYAKSPANPFIYRIYAKQGAWGAVPTRTNRALTMFDSPLRCRTVITTLFSCLYSMVPNPEPYFACVSAQW